MESFTQFNEMSAKAHYKKVRAKLGKTFPSINKRDHPEIRGLEGPFRFKNGKVAYYDPKEGKYYDNTTDIYLTLKDIGER